MGLHRDPFGRRCMQVASLPAEVVSKLVSRMRWRHRMCFWRRMTALLTSPVKSCIPIRPVSGAVSVSTEPQRRLADTEKEVKSATATATDGTIG
ncbi:unnamed protein product [Linum tenue]|uniref:Uncharacterized protein n=1 Tax=Linum tenue TaxID=586396 RepID=A0AAV0RRH5_9ROSI|nr:unnamed protein product [Linum tenue]